MNWMCRPIRIHKIMSLKNLSGINIIYLQSTVLPPWESILLILYLLLYG